MSSYYSARLERRKQQLQLNLQQSSVINDKTAQTAARIKEDHLKMKWTQCHTQRDIGGQENKTCYVCFFKLLEVKAFNSHLLCSLGEYMGTEHTQSLL